jgi:CHASE2 domain-containing sensor protein
LAEPPASITELLAYLRAAAWVPSLEEHPLLVAAGRAYGYVVAVPGSLVLYGMAWLIQRPARLALAIALALIVPLTA